MIKSLLWHGCYILVLFCPVCTIHHTTYSTQSLSLFQNTSIYPATGEPEQSIQPEVEKPQQPDGETLTNPEEKPDGTPVETTPEPVDHDTYVPPADDGGTGGGGGLPGFDYVPNGGENIETFAGDMYENGNKIGSMD